MDILSAITIIILLGVGVVMGLAGKNYWDADTKIGAALVSIAAACGLVALVMWMKLG